MKNVKKSNNQKQQGIDKYIYIKLLLDRTYPIVLY